MALESRRIGSSAAVVLFLSAIVAANLAVATYGQAALVITAWIVIPFDMLTRDLLHERWRNDRLALRMGALVLLGGAITILLSSSTWRVAVGSCLAFALAMGVNSIVFERLIERTRFRRMTASNAAAAIVDSIAFPLIAFGTLDPVLSLAQASSKTLGGVAWTAAALYLLPRIHARSHTTN